MNAAYSTYYGGSSVSSSPRTSTSSSRNNSTTIAVPQPAPAQALAKKAPTNAERAWNAIKKQHREMNKAYAVYYGRGEASSTRRI